MLWIMDITTFSLIVALAILIITYYIFIYREWKKLDDIIDKIPGPPRYPILGTTIPILVTKRENLFDLFQQRTKRYEPYFRTWLGRFPEIHFMKPDHLEIIMASSVHIDKGHSYDFIIPWLGRGLLISKGKMWHSRRKLLTPAFHFKILEDFLDVFVENVQKLTEKLKESPRNEYFDIYPYVNDCALDIICETAMGVKVHAMENSNNAYVSAVREMSELILQRIFRPWLHFDFLFKFTKLGKQYFKDLSILHSFTEKVIQERKATFSRKNEKQKTREEDVFLGKKPRLAFLDLLLEASKDGTILTDTEIRHEVDTFMFEGHDTTTVAICWCLFLLGNHPEIQEKVNEELYSIFHGEDRAITMADLGEMKYLERVIKESLRLYPSVPFISRLVTQSFQVDDYLIPAGCTAVLQLYDVQRDPEHFPNPERFDPDRFLPEACQKRHPFAYVPFSAGPRNCIGQKFAMMEEKTIIASIVKNYKIISLENQKEIKVYAELILRPQNGIQVKLQSR